LGKGALTSQLSQEVKFVILSAAKDPLLHLLFWSVIPAGNLLL
jgi:hypothetical protein